MLLTWGESISVADLDAVFGEKATEGKVLAVGRLQCLSKPVTSLR